MRKEGSEIFPRFSGLSSRFAVLLPGSLFSFLISLFSLLILIALIEPASAAVIKSTWIETRGAVVTIHLRLSGRPRWILSQQTSRLQIDLLDTRASLAPNQFLHAAAGTLGTVMIIGTPDKGLRMQIDVTAKCDYVVGRLRNQLIVSLAPRAAGLNLADTFNAASTARSGTTVWTRRTAPVSPPPPARPVPEQIARTDLTDTTPAPAADGVESQVQGHPIVVVDPGHGGQDPGTHSADGLLEKDLALQIGRRLADALARRGIKPVMTRDGDEYLTLAQRTAIANHSGAELFVSVHLNWSPNPGTAGMEVYYLNNTTDRATIRLARMENAADGGRTPLDSNLNYILSDLQQQYKATESALLAQVMEEQTVGALESAFGDNIAALGAKRGPFYVLVGPKIPAVLVECGFLSNAGEARHLANPEYQQVLADALAASLVHYLNQDVTAGTL